MRRNVIIYLIALFVSVILGRMRPGFVSTMIFYMMICLPFAEIAMIIITYVNFRVDHGIDKRTVVKGDSIHYNLSFVTPTFLLFAPLRVHYTGSEILFEQSDLEGNSTIVLPPFAREKFEKDIQCDYRGSYYVGVEKVRINGFFHLFYYHYTGMETLKILVHPNIYELKAVRFRHALSESSESIVSFDKYDRSVFSELRAYRPGDALNRIHWKLSAGKDALITKEFEGNVNNKTQVFINTQIGHLPYEQNIVVEDYLIEGVVALSKFLLKNSTETELHWYDFNVHKQLRGSHEKDFTDFYEALAEIVFDAHEEAGIQMLESVGNGRYDQCVMVFFTAQVTAALAEELLRKKQQGNQVNLVTLPLKDLEIGGHEIEMAVNPVYRLMDSGIQVYHLTFEEGVCRMEVA